MLWSNLPCAYLTHLIQLRKSVSHIIHIGESRVTRSILLQPVTDEFGRDGSLALNSLCRRSRAPYSLYVACWTSPQKHSTSVQSRCYMEAARGHSGVSAIYDASKTPLYSRCLRLYGRRSSQGGTTRSQNRATASRNGSPNDWYK